MPDKHPEPQAQLWNRPGGPKPPKPPSAPTPAQPLTLAGPLHGGDTIMVTRAGQTPVAVPLSALAAYFLSVGAAHE